MRRSDFISYYEDTINPTLLKVYECLKMHDHSCIKPDVNFFDSTFEIKHTGGVAIQLHIGDSVKAITTGGAITVAINCQKNTLSQKVKDSLDEVFGLVSVENDERFSEEGSEIYYLRTTADGNILPGIVDLSESSRPLFADGKNAALLKEIQKAVEEGYINVFSELDAEIVDSTESATTESATTESVTIESATTESVDAESVTFSQAEFNDTMKYQAIKDDELAYIDLTVNDSVSDLPADGQFVVNRTEEPTISDFNFGDDLILDSLPVTDSVVVPITQFSDDVSSYTAAYNWVVDTAYEHPYIATALGVAVVGSLGIVSLNALAPHYALAGLASAQVNTVFAKLGMISSNVIVNEFSGEIFYNQESYVGDQISDANVIWLTKLLNTKDLSTGNLVDVINDPDIVAKFYNIYSNVSDYFFSRLFGEDAANAATSLYVDLS